MLDDSQLKRIRRSLPFLQTADASLTRDFQHAAAFARHRRAGVVQPRQERPEESYGKGFPGSAQRHER